MFGSGPHRGDRGRRDDRDGLATGDREGDVVHRDEVLLVPPHGEDLLQALDLDDVVRCGIRLRADGLGDDGGRCAGGDAERGGGGGIRRLVRVRRAEGRGAQADRAVMIGDTSFDMEMAQAAGMTGFGVDWGYHPAERLHATGAALVAPDYPALTAALLDWAEERAA